MYDEEITEELERILGGVREIINASTAGKSICSIQKHGSPSDDLKFNEGKEFIVRKVLALIEREASEDRINAFLSENERKFVTYKSSESTASTSWQSYADGGFEGIALIRNLLHIT